VSPRLPAIVLAALLAVPPAALAAGVGADEDPAARATAGASVFAPDLGVPLPGIVDPDRYHVGPGDRFTLLLWGSVSQAHPLVVGPEGDVVIPEIGTVNVAGRTLAEARTMIRERVRRSLRNLEVDVQLSRLRTFRVYLTGAVRQPGPVAANGVNRVMDLLPDTLLATNASRRNIEVRRSDGSRATVDLLKFQLTGDAVGDPWLREGDVVHVPAATRFVGVWGAVPLPGEFELGPADSVSTLLRLAGGVLPKVLGEEASLVRWKGVSERETLAVRIADGRVAGGDQPLRDGDQLYVLQHPDWHESMQVWVYGRVGREGVFPIRVGSTRITEVIAAAGGLLDDADRSAIRLVRRAPGAHADPEFDRLLRLSRGEMTRSEYEAFRAQLAARSPDVLVDWTLLEGGRSDLDVLLKDGDIIHVDRVTNVVRVDGQVRRPGLVPYSEGRPSSWYVEQAGGYTQRAAISQVRVTRAANGQGMLARDAARISPGDQIWVPEKPDTSAWKYVTEALVVMAQLATVWLAVRPH
jgi:polysaccharide biosynthesis/export protein